MTSFTIRRTLDPAPEEDTHCVRRLTDFYQQPVLTVALCELRTLAAIREMIIEQSLAHQKNRSGFYNMDLKK